MLWPKSVHRAAFVVVALSGLMTALALTGPIYMLQVYDRVLTGRSFATLAVLSIIAALLLAAYFAADVIRTALVLSFHELRSP
jgi:ABC-type protease/lipase transport system fused ATPase/permease subunit